MTFTQCEIRRALAYIATSYNGIVSFSNTAAQIISTFEVFKNTQKQLVMKKNLKIVAAALFTFTGLVSNAQSLNINWGFTTSSATMEDETSDLSANESWGCESYNSSFETKNISGYNVGIGYESKLGERLSVETGFKYIKRGYKVVSESSYASSWDNYEETSTNEAKIKMNYLDLPVVLNTAILTGDFRLYVRTGIFAGYLASARYLEQSEYNSSDGGFESYEYNSF